MNEKIDREHVSEHLSALVQGELAAPQRERVEEHLQDCAECKEELRGVRALLEMEEVRLEEVERARLHEAVASALDPTPAPRDDNFGVWVPPRRSLWSRFAPSLGAAALLLVAVIAGLTVSGDGVDDGGGESGGAGDRAVEDTTEGGSDEKGGGGGGQPAGGQPAPQDAPAGTEETGETTNDLESLNGRTFLDYLDGRPGPRFVGARAVGKATEERSLDDVVHGQFWAPYERAYNARDAARYEKDSLLALKESAPDDVSDRVKWCGNRFRAIFDQPLLAVYGSLGRFDTSDTLVLGFLSSERSRGPLSSYVLGAWSGSCNEGYRHLQGPLTED